LLVGVAGAASAAPAAAQVARLAPAPNPIEIVDPSERISGNATAGLVLMAAADENESTSIRTERNRSDRIGSERLWAYLSEPVPAKLKLRISSIDGRYYAEVDYPTASHEPGWVALELNLQRFSFLEDNYGTPIDEIAALLSDAEAPRFYPVRWAAPHRSPNATAPAWPKDDDKLRVYMNTERSQAFVVVGGAPVYCSAASAMSGFKFNAICELKLGDLRLPAPNDGQKVVEGIEVFRRAGVRAPTPLALDLNMRY
jgi:hypothetical protein